MILACLRRWTPYLATALLIGNLLLIGGCSDAEEDAANQSTRRVSDADIDIALEAAEHYFQMADLDKAHAIAEEVIQDAPDRVVTHELLGQIALAKAQLALDSGDRPKSVALFGRAVEAYEAALKLDESSAGLHHSAGMIFYAAGHLQRALVAFEDACSLDAANPQHPLYAAQMLLKTDQKDEAFRKIHEALALDDDEPFAHATLASILAGQGKFDEALESIREARSIHPDEISFIAKEGAILREAGYPRLSMELLASVPAGSRSLLMFVEQKAATSMALLDLDGALQAWSSGYELALSDPEYAKQGPRCAKEKAQCLLLKGERGEALNWLNAARNADPWLEGLDELEAQIRAAGASE